MKTCFKCGKSQPEENFYKHKKMSDGLLGKCKACTKTDTNKQHHANQQIPEKLIKERERQRIKERKRRELGLTKKYSKRCVTVAEYPQKIANQIVGNAIRDGKLIRLPCVICGDKKSQGHHEDYSKPLDVVWLCVRHHNDRHIYLRNCEAMKENPKEIQLWIDMQPTYK